VRIEVEIEYLTRTTEKHIRRALKYIDAADLEGLGAIRVVDQSPADPDENKYPPYLNSIPPASAAWYFSFSLVRACATEGRYHRL